MPRRVSFGAATAAVGLLCAAAIVTLSSAADAPDVVKFPAPHGSLELAMKSWNGTARGV